MIKQFFQDENGQFSMMRLCTFILVVNGVVLCFIFPDKSVGEIVIGLGLSGKVSQKIFGEKKTISNEPKTN